MSPTDPASAREARDRRFDAYVRTWRELQAETRPIDRQVAARAMGRLHEKVWGKTAKEIFCFDSPLAAGAARLIRQENKETHSVAPPDDRGGDGAGPTSFSMRLSDLIDDVYEEAFACAKAAEEAGQAERALYGLFARMDLQRSTEARLFDVRPLRLEFHLNTFSGYWVHTDISPAELQGLMGERPVEWVEEMRRQACLAMGREPVPLVGLSEDERFRTYRNYWRLDMEDDIWLRGAVNRCVEVLWIARQYKLPLKEETLDWFDALFAVASSGGYGIWSDGEVAAIVERPSFIALDAQQRLHNENGPAMIWRDGYRIYAWKGCNLPPGLIENKDAITVKDIVLIENEAMRRAMIDILGKERFARTSGARMIFEDDTGKLWRLEFDWFKKADPGIRHVAGAERFKNRHWPDRDVWQAVEVRNATPEADGSFRTYFLEVPRRVRTAREAVAWTFGMPAEDYRPDVES